MSTSAAFAELRQIPVASVQRNPENPRLLLRQGELEQLLESIRIHGIQVPIAVFKEGRKHVLIDGERRWRCAVKLNHDTIPALIQEKPPPLTNLLLMFNIHSLREQWDLITIALKLPRVIDLLERDSGKAPTERDLAQQTGLSRAVIRRSKLLGDLPQEYKEIILAEVAKPKPQQHLTEDFFIEMERALKTVERAMPRLVTGKKDKIRHVLIDKYDKGVIPNIVQFRLIGKIARADRVDVNEHVAGRALRTLFESNDYSVEDAYRSTVSGAYEERDVRQRITALIERIEQFTPADVDADLRRQLRRLIAIVQRLLKARK